MHGMGGIVVAETGVQSGQTVYVNGSVVLVDVGQILIVWGERQREVGRADGWWTQSRRQTWCFPVRHHGVLNVAVPYSAWKRIRRKERENLQLLIFSDYCTTKGTNQCTFNQVPVSGYDSSPWERGGVSCRRQGFAPPEEECTGYCNHVRLLALLVYAS